MPKKIWNEPIDKRVDWGGDEHTEYAPVSGAMVQKFIKDSIDQIDNKLTELESKTSEISKVVITTTDDSISIEDNSGNEVFHLDENGLNAKNVKSNGKDVLTEHQDISGFATKEEMAKKQDKIKGFSEESTEDSSKKIIIGVSEEEPTVIVDEDAVRVKRLKDLKGNDIGNTNIDTKDILKGVFTRGKYITSSGSYAASDGLNSFSYNVARFTNTFYVKSVNVKSNGTILWAGFSNGSLIRSGSINPDPDNYIQVDLVDVSDFDTLVVNCLASGICEVYTLKEQKINQQNNEMLLNDLLFVNKKALFLGDSIMQGVGSIAQHSAVDYAKEYLRCEAINGGIGGTTMRDDGRTANLVKIIDAIVNNDWSGIKSWMDNITDTDALTNEMKHQFDILYSADLSQLDFVFIAYGFNDWNSSPSANVFDDVENTENTSTVLGALRNTIRRLQSKYPHLKLFVATPGFAQISSDNTDNIIKNGKKLWELGNDIEAVCKSYHIPCMNQYFTNNVNEFNAGLYLRDGVHRNAYGYMHMGHQYAKFIINNY